MALVKSTSVNQSYSTRVRTCSRESGLKTPFSWTWTWDIWY